MQWNRGGGGGGGPGGSGQALRGERARPQRSSIEILKRVAAVFWPYRVAVFALLVTVTASALIGLAPPLLFASIIDNVNKTKNAHRVDIDAALIFGAVLAGALLSVLQSYLN